MFARQSGSYKPAERDIARRLREKEGLPIRRIAKLLGVSPSSVHGWTSDIDVAPEHRDRNLNGPGGPNHPETVAKRNAAWIRLNRERRETAQMEGREQARAGDPLHLAGCMLYWAEGDKNRNTLGLSNSDPDMLRFFCRFLRRTLEVSDDRLALRVNVYLGGDLTIEDVRCYWLDALELRSSNWRQPIVDHAPTSSSGKRPHRLPFGVARVRVLKSTYLLQHIYGAIQEYAEFDEPRWLDLPRRAS